MTYDQMMHEFSLWDCDDRIRNLLRLHDPDCRKLDVEVAAKVLNWTDVKMLATTDWQGVSPDGRKLYVPTFSHRECVARAVVNYLLRKFPYLRCKDFKSKSDPDSTYFGWSVYLPKQGEHCLVAAVQNKSAALAISKATLDLFEFMREGDHWEACWNSWNKKALDEEELVDAKVKTFSF